jgi:predicted TIM-barrel fold metal-dependent hydrolase
MVLAIDAWAQPAPPGAFTSTMFAPLVARAQASDRVSMAASPEKIIEAMDQAGVAKALLSAWRLQDGWMVSNDQIAEIVSRFPDRFVGVASVGLDDPDAATDLETMVTQHAFKALRVLPWVWNRPPNQTVTDRFLKNASRLAYRIVRRSATPARGCRRSPDDRFPISMK